MIQALKIEYFLVRFAASRVIRVVPNLFPSVFLQAAKSYACLFVLGIITLSAIQLYNAAASRNDAIYVAFLLLLSYIYTTRTILFGFQKLAEWAGKRGRSQESEPNGSAPKFAVVIISLVALLTFSLIPPLLVFRVQDLAWAEHMCAFAILVSAGATTVLTVLAYNFSRIRSLVAKLPTLFGQVPRIDFSGVAGRIYQESRKPAPPLA